MPWCAVAGNHDWGGGTVHSQVDYHTENPKGKWYMPGLYYTRTWALPQGKRLQVGKRVVIFKRLGTQRAHRG